MDFDRKDLLRKKLGYLVVRAGQQLETAEAKIVSEFAVRQIQSSSEYSLIAQAYRDHLRTLGSEMIAEAKRILHPANIEVFDDVKDFLEQEWAAASTTLQQKIEGRLQSLFFKIGRFNSWVQPVKDLLQTLSGPLRDEINLEIELLVSNFQKSPSLHLSLQPGDVFKANQALRRMFESANKTLDIIDNYFGPEVFDMLEITKPAVQVRLLSENCEPKITRPAYVAFKKQFSRVEYRLSPPGALHDRFVIIDGHKCIAIGHSLKDLGKKMSEIHEVPIGTRLKEFDAMWSQATAV